MKNEELKKQKLAQQDQTMRYGQLLKYYGMKSREMHVPLTGTFELTPRCNMNCKMCYIRMTEKEMEKVGKEVPVDEWIRIAEEASKAGMMMILLTGGEAILYKDFKKLFLALRKMGLFISINSNGTMLTGPWLDFFRENPPAKFNLTIYGGCNETYERLCGNPKGFDQLKAGVEKLQELHIPIRLNCMITKQNVCDLDAILAFGKEHNLKVHATSYAFPPVRKEGVVDPELDRFDAKESAKTRVLIEWNTMEKEAFRQRAKKIATDIRQVEILGEPCAEAEGDKVRCAAGRANFWVTWDGRMLPCGMIPDFSVPIRERAFKDAWDEVVSHTQMIRLAPECKVCKKKKLCAPCAAKLNSETGCYDQKSDYLCEYIDEYLRLMGEAKKYLEHEQENR